MNSSELIRKLAKSNFSVAREAVSALENCPPNFQAGSVSCTQLLDIYKVRLKHIDSMAGIHAKQLATSTKEFVANLEATGDEQAQAITINLDEGIIFVIFLSSSGKLLGCLKTISKLAVTEERWEQLWAKP